MIWYHTFAFPDRVGGQTYISLGNVSSFSIEVIIANFGHICVNMFLFLSGYGLYKTYNNNVSYQEIFKRIYKLYLNYWSVFILFIPLGFLLGRYAFNFKVCLLNFLAISSSYNAEWWFLRLYIMLILLYPMIIQLLNRYNNMLILIFSFGVNILGLVFTKLSYTFGINLFAFDLLNILMGGQFSFVIGMVISKNGIFNKMRDKMGINRKTYILYLLLLIPCMSILLEIPMIGEILKLVLVPFFIFLVANTLPSFKILQYIGQHSTNIWLTHSFFCYYYFSQLTFLPKFSFLIFIWIMILSLISSCIVNKIYKKILNMQINRVKIYFSSKDKIAE